MVKVSTSLVDCFNCSSMQKYAFVVDTRQRKLEDLVRIIKGDEIAVMVKQRPSPGAFSAALARRARMQRPSVRGRPQRLDVMLRPR